jgi:hypothetical protein
LPILSWTCAHGDAPAVTIPCAATVAIAPDDNSVDTNQVIVSGTGTITSFGSCSTPITKRVYYGAGVTLINSASLVLLAGANRTTSAPSIGTYSTAGDGVWREELFSVAGAVESLEAEIAALQAEITALQSRVATLETEVAANTAKLANHTDWLNYIVNEGLRPPTGP